MAGTGSQARRGRPRRNSRPVGVLLAGGVGRRIGGDKPRLELAGRPLAHYALDALNAALDDVVVACRLDTDLPPLPGVREAWVEPEGPRGPLAGICSALREAGGRPIVACAISLPLITPEVLSTLASATDSGASVVVPEAGGRLHPLAARWEASALDTLGGLPVDMKLDAVLETLDPAVVPFADEECFLRVEVPEDLLRAGAALDARRRRTRALA